MSGSKKSGAECTGWVCTGCGKHVSGSIPVDVCSDCGGEWIEATPDRLACEGCGADDASRVLNSDHNRLCEDCIRRENNIPVDALDELRGEWEQAARGSTSGRSLGLETAADELRVLVEEHKGLPEDDDGLRADGGAPTGPEVEAAAATRRADKTVSKTPNCVLGGQPIGECGDCDTRFDYGRGTAVAIMNACPECGARDWDVWGYRYNGEEIPSDEAWDQADTAGDRDE